MVLSESAETIKAMWNDSSKDKEGWAFYHTFTNFSTRTRYSLSPNITISHLLFAL